MPVVTPFCLDNPYGRGASALDFPSVPTAPTDPE